MSSRMAFSLTTESSALYIINKNADLETDAGGR
jgi:hypothetical protein